MAFSEIAAVAVFVAVVLFGIVDAVVRPMKIRRLYRDRGFVDQGEKKLSECSKARIVDEMYTEHWYKDKASGISQLKAWSVNRKKFTVSKVSRKRNRAPWSVTIVDAKLKPISCLILPTVVPEAIGYVGNGRNMDFEHDLEIANRYHIETDNEALIRSIMVGEVREFLLKPHIVFIEVSENQLVMKRTWADHLVIERLEKELEIVGVLKEQLKE